MKKTRVNLYSRVLPCIDLNLPVLFLRSLYIRLQILSIFYFKRMIIMEMTPLSYVCMKKEINQSFARIRSLCCRGFGPMGATWFPTYPSTLVR